MLSLILFPLSIQFSDAAGPALLTADPKTVTDEQWRKKLTPLQYEVTRQKGTEPAFTGKYWDNHKPGEYRCSNCGAKLFVSTSKFDSGTGRPSFDQPADKKGVYVSADHSFASSVTKSRARAVGLIWVMYSMTDPHLPASATA